MNETYNENTMRETLGKILADPIYLRNIEYGEPRPGHPEGKIKNHIADLELNLEQLKSRGISSSEYWKLKFLIHVHDTFKAESEQNVPILHARSHASLARQYASQYTDDQDLLNMIQFHDMNYSMWLDQLHKGSYDTKAFQVLLDTIQDWDLFLMFNIIDGRTTGKDTTKLVWFIDEAGQRKSTRVNSTWIDPL
ncbi:MAG TPA: hypothetical protein VJ785_00540 [Anaerolineales bacterium]|nr:hypothetical protein [Anaerolineales bacterium]